ncbi:hypothetical protein LTR22_011957 [Elasticomyces elasticus]|nr:hypothetical protein LTR22_011957 [Elasticomyces elasticus]KAK4930146.1 hypothetical protein LTR49_003179 [Elasticomyces elasticus]KAK5752483.1 hypothetical protein LTS12_017420 [Elasticomyces elasticus]
MTATRKRVVRSKPVRTGCRTCRIRRIKCDEGLPACAKCVRSGWTCDGYEASPPPSTGEIVKRPLLPKLDDWCAAPLPITVSTLKFSVTDADRTAFAYFTRNVRVDHLMTYSRFTDNRQTFPDILIISPLRECLLLAVQQSFDSPHLFYAITAVGCAHHSLPFIIDTSLNRYYLDSTRTKSVTQYGKALSALQTVISGASKSSDAVVSILLACMLFGTFEVMEDRGKSATAHMKYGRSIIFEHLSKSDMQAVVKPEGRAQSQLCGLPVQLVEAFLGLVDDEAVWSITRTLVDCEEPQCAFRARQPFKSLEEARQSLGVLLDATNDCRKELIRCAENQMALSSTAPPCHATKTCLSLCISRALDPKAHPALFARIDALRAALISWADALKATIPTDTLSSRRALAFMHIQHFTATFTLIAVGHRDEAFTKTLHPEFVRVLDLCEQYFDVASAEIEVAHKRPYQPSPSEERQGGFSLELKVLPALYLIVHRCRDPAIRRRAISILYNSNRREGLFFSRVLCLSGEAFIEIEEVLEASEQRVASFAEVMIAGTDVTGNDDRYFTDPIKSSPQGPTLPPNAPAWRYAEVVMSGNEGPPPSMTMWCGRFVEGGIEIVKYEGKGWPVKMARAGSTMFPYS